MPEFSPGKKATATISLVVKPADLSCEAELFLGPNDLTKVATSGRITFTSAGLSEKVLLPITMPSQTGSYKVFLDVYAGKQPIASYIGSENVQVQVPIIPWSFSNFTTEIVEWYSPAGYLFHFVTYSIIVKNNGSQTATKTVSLYSSTYDWFLVESKELTLAAGQAYEFFSPSPAFDIMIFPGWKYDLQFRTSDGEVSNIISVSLPSSPSSPSLPSSPSPSMITISLRNPPSKAALWLPVFRVGGVGGNVHYPSHNLNLDESWQVDLDGHLDFRVDILDSANRLLDQTWFIPYTINDGRTYIYDWNTKQLLEATAGG